MTQRCASALPLSDQPPREECGVFGVYAPGEEVAQLTYFGLYALQHRGQESAGIATSDGQRVTVFKDMGLVAQVFDESSLAALKGHLAIGHTRYSTCGSSVWENAQPTLRATETGSVAMAHNGNLVNTAELAQAARAAGVHGPSTHDADLPLSTSDSGLMTALLAAHPSGDLEQAALEVLPTLRGAFSLVFMDEHRLFAARDPHGVRPLVVGRLATGWVVASETAALDIVGASVVREVEPGEMLVISGAAEQDLRSTRFTAATPKGCVFEYVYLARPDTRIAGRSVHAARVAVGRRLAGVAPVEADVVIPVPESGTPAAIGYAQASGIPYGMGLVKNSYVGRTFIAPTQLQRRRGIHLKLNPLREVVAGKRLVVVDDSIVRGNTQQALVAMLREAGAAQVHVRIASAPVVWPCHYGVDFATRAELISADRDVEQIREHIGADSLAYIPLEDMTAATGIPVERLCRACFDGSYPIPLPEPTQLNKTLLERKHTGDAVLPQATTESVAGGVQEGGYLSGLPSAPHSSVLPPDPSTPQQVSLLPHPGEEVSPARLVVLVSGGGTNLQAILDACADPAYGAQVVAVGADRDNIYGLERARLAGIPTFVERLGDYPDREAWNVALTEQVASYHPDLVLCAGFMKLLSPHFLSHFPQRIINTHPSLLPAFAGDKAVADALAAGVKVTGVTVMYIDEGIDTGPILAQQAVPVLPGDDAATLHERIKEVERPLFVATVGELVQRLCE